MALYQVPTDISEKEKIVGGLLTAGQLISLLVGVGIGLGSGFALMGLTGSTIPLALCAILGIVGGGLFALNLERFEEAQNAVWYFAPDTLEWESLDVSYTGFIKWVLTGDTEGFYSSMRWDSWEQDCKTISFEEVMLIYPFLWANECNINTASKKAVPFNELYNLNLENWRKFNK